MAQSNKKVHVIYHFEALFNDEKMTCGLAINLDEFSIPVYDLVEPEPTFEVDFKNKKIIITGKNDLVEFINCDDELLTRALKTDVLAILFGRSLTLEIEGALIAKPVI